MQFAPYRSGKVEFIIANGPNSTCIRAAQEVLAGARIGDYLFFMTQYWADYYRIKNYVMIGNHAFFYRWETYDPPAEETPQEDAAPAEEPAPAEENQDNGGESSEGQEENSGSSEENNEESSGEENNEGSEEGSDGGE